MKKYPLSRIFISLFALALLNSLSKAEACQELGVKELKIFKDKTGVDLKQSFILPLSSIMTAPKELAVQWDRQQKKKWMILLPTTKINEMRVTDYRIFACSGPMMAYYPCTKPLYQLRVQLNPAESCQTVQSDKMNILVLASAENSNLKILDMLFEINPTSHQVSPLGLLVLEDMEISKKESIKIGQ